MSKYSFTNSRFGINSSYFYLMRSGYVYKKIPLSQIKKVEIKRGSRIKHPIRSVAFSLLLMWLVFTLIPNKEFLFFDPVSALFDISHLLVIIPEFLIMFGFLVAIAIAIFIQATFPVPTIKFHLNDGKHFIYLLKPFQKKGQDNALNSFLEEQFGHRFTNKLS